LRLPTDSLLVASGDGLFANMDGLWLIELLRRLPADEGGGFGSMIVCERETRFGTARGPPGTVGVLGIFTRRGWGGAGLAEDF